MHALLARQMQTLSPLIQERVLRMTSSCWTHVWNGLERRLSSRLRNWPSHHRLRGVAENVLRYWKLEVFCIRGYATVRLRRTSQQWTVTSRNEMQQSNNCSLTTTLDRSWTANFGGPSSVHHGFVASAVAVKRVDIDSKVCQIEGYKSFGNSQKS